MNQFTAKNRRASALYTGRSLPVVLAWHTGFHGNKTNTHSAASFNNIFIPHRLMRSTDCACV
jgi:hypothetical protein